MPSLTGPAGSGPVSTLSVRAVRFWMAVGWALLLGLVLTAALLGGIGANVRAFQAAYCGGFLGYIVLAWLVTRASEGSRAAAWRWWLLGCVVLRGPLIATEPTDDAYRYMWEG